MFSKMSILAVFAVAIFSSLSLVESQDCGHTRIITPRHFLNIPKFLGRWYTQKHAMTKAEDVYEPKYKCLSSEWAVKEGSRLWLNETFLWTNGSSNEVQHTMNEALVETVGAPAYLSSNYTDTDGTPGSINFVILASDHYSYSIQYSCEMRNGTRFETAFASTRVRIPDSILDSFLTSILEGLGFAQKNFVNVDQSGCGDI